MTERIASMRIVEGFADPLFTEELSTNRNGPVRNGISDPKLLDRIAAGYACAQCLALFTMYVVRCPVCGLERNVAADIEAKAPALWQAHLDEREKGYEKTVPGTIDDIGERIKAGEMEDIPLSKLHYNPQRRKAGRPK